LVKQGFLNLSQEEQVRVLEAALDEFAERDFESASLNRIIQNAGISKGSMYHYFQNKEDLYMYMLDKVMEEKKHFLLGALQSLGRPVQELNFFDSLAFQLEVSLQFAGKNPRYHMINTHLQNMLETGLKKRIFGRLGAEFDSYIAAMVDSAIATGQFQNNLDRDFTMRILRFFLLKFTDLYPDYREILQHGDEVMASEMKKVVEFLKHGLCRPSRKDDK
jgi:AcrR family transcriptional regulator